MNAKTYLSASLLAAALIGSLLLTGCVSSAKVTTSPSEGVGQQLMDLEKAYKDGIITQDQYDKLKQQIIKKNS